MTIQALQDDPEDDDVLTRTDLDSHANMPVVGGDVHILADTGKTAMVNAFSPELEPLNLKIVDCVVAYNKPHTGETVLLTIYGALYAPAMEHNLVPPFMMREAGIIVDTMPKCQADEPTEQTHSLY